MIPDANFREILEAIASNDARRREVGSSWVGDVVNALDLTQANTFATTLAKAAASERRTEVQESLLNALLDLIAVHEIDVDALAPVFGIPPEQLNEENADYVDDLREYRDLRDARDG